MQQYKGISKFKGYSLQNEKELSIMFDDIRNTGDDHWGPSDRFRDDLARAITLSRA
jgi:hypothetical protein